MTNANQHCLFCRAEYENALTENRLAYSIRDAFPVTEHHSLVIPKRHVVDFFGLTNDEVLACTELIRLLRDDIRQLDDSVKGFNIGMNAGTAAGQTIFHCHIHLIPRRPGDVADPRGGIRHTMPGKGFY